MTKNRLKYGIDFKVEKEIFYFCAIFQKQFIIFYLALYIYLDCMLLEFLEATSKMYSMGAIHQEIQWIFFNETQYC